MNLSTQDFLQRAFDESHLQLITSGKSEKIRYIAVNVTEKWSDPEEKVRAAYYAELIYRYGYKPECIGVEVTVPDRTSRSCGSCGFPRRHPHAAFRSHRMQA
jgi:type I restriction enzyme M protein